MKITHRKVERCKKLIELDSPITEIKISDPWYDKNVWCRYENNNIPAMKMLEIYYDTSHIDVSEEGYSYDLKECVFHMTNNYAKGMPEQEKQFEIGVDTARYEIQTNHNSIDIRTGADGGWGCVLEDYYNGELGEIYIRLIIPEDVMSREEFLGCLKMAFGIKEELEFVVLMDDDISCDEEQNIESLDGIEMK